MSIAPYFRLNISKILSPLTLWISHDSHYMVDDVWKAGDSYPIWFLHPITLLSKFVWFPWFIYLDMSSIRCWVLKIWKLVHYSVLFDILSKFKFLLHGWVLIDCRRCLYFLILLFKCSSVFVCCFEFFTDLWDLKISKLL